MSGDLRKLLIFHQFVAQFKIAKDINGENYQIIEVKDWRCLFLIGKINVSCYIQQNIQVMGLVLSSETLDLIGIIYSGIGVALALFETFVKKVHSRALDYIQWSYILALANTALLGTFSNYLYVGSSLIALNSQALAEFYCPMGSYVCVRAFALSFLAILVGFIVIMRLITIPEKVTEKGITFPRVYRLLKGLFKWFFLPLVYLSISTLLSSSSEISIPAIVVLAVLIVFPIVQVILYKRFDDQSQDPFIKWLQLCNYAKAALFALLVVLATINSTTSFYYYIAFIIVAYAIFFALKHNFSYEIAGRVIYIAGEVLFYFLFSLFVSGSAWLKTYYIDLFVLGIILIIDVVYLIMESVVEYKKWKGQGEILPEDSGPTKKNRYEVEQLGVVNKNDSRDNLNDSRASSNNMLGNSSSIKKKDTRARPGGK